MDGFFSGFGSINDILIDVAIIAIPALICITIHELAHGYIAYRLGHNTAKQMGRLTLNPIKHIDLVGLVMILLVGFGWAKPVPVNMRNFKHPKWYMAITAIAGPLSNIILAVFVILVLVLLPMTTPVIVRTIVNRMAFLSVILAIFNLLPIPPLDGSKVLFSLLPNDKYNKLMQYERFGMILIIALLFSGRFLEFDIFTNIVILPAWVMFSNIYEFFISILI